MGQLGMLILINLIIGLVIPRIDNAAHVGGLVAGLWLGFLIVPGRVPTLRSLWTRPTSAGGTFGGAAGGGGPTDGPAERSMLLPMLGVAALIVVLVVGIVLGTEARRIGRASSTADGGQVAVVVTDGTSGSTTPTRAPRGARFSA
jgi:hypothetical protein